MNEAQPVRRHFGRTLVGYLLTGLGGYYAKLECRFCGNAQATPTLGRLCLEQLSHVGVWNTSAVGAEARHVHAVGFV
jgi:hypothetical protein